MRPQTLYLFTSERLGFRALTSDDALFAYQLNADREVIQYTGDAPFDSVEEARTFLDQYTDYEVHGMGRWGVEDRSTGQLIGWSGLKYLIDEDAVDLGYRFFREEWGKGYATEAAQACLRYGFEVLKIPRIVAHVMEENIGSIRVLEKVGMAFQGRGTACGSTTLNYAIEQTKD